MRGFTDYYEVMKQSNLSTHEHQLAKRREKYPTEFVVKSGIVYISLRLTRVLKKYHAAVVELQNLRKGVSHESR